MISVNCIFRRFVIVFFLAGLTAQTADKGPVYRVGVDLVVVNFTVTDHKGRYISGLRPNEIRILEDGIAQKIDSFSEGRKILQGNGTPETESNSIFILFDTSNCMYDKFVHAQDAIADFIRGLDPADSVAVYSFSRNLTRMAPLTRDHNRAIAQLRQTVAGDDTALYNALLLTVRDAARVPGRKVVIVFSNGPDNASILSPDDVRRVAEDEGVAIYVISTQTEDPISDAVFTRLTSGTGGRYHTARRWQHQAKAFEAVREDIASHYTVTYYPSPREAHGFRKIDVEILEPDKTRSRRNVHARSGYRPRG